MQYFQGFLLVRSTGLEPGIVFFARITRLHNSVNMQLLVAIVMRMHNSFLQKHKVKRVLLCVLSFRSADQVSPP